MVMMPQPQGRIALPFRPNTRRKRVQVEQKTFVHGSRLTYELPQVGLLSKVYVTCDITFTGSTSNLADKGPWNILSRIRLKLNLGSQIIWDLSGYESFIMCSMLHKGGRLDVGGLGSAAADADIYAAAVADGANTWKLILPIPVSANFGKNFEPGLINLQAEQLRFFVEVDCGQQTDATDDGTFSAGTVSVAYEYYEVPAGNVALPELILCKTESERSDVVSTGDQTIKILQQGTLMQLVHIFTANGVRNNLIDSFKLRFNKTEFIEDNLRSVQKVEQRQLYGVDWPTGVFHHTFWGYADQHPSSGDNRDFIDTEELANFDSILTVNSGVTLGSGNNFIDTIRRYIQVAAA